MSRAEGGGGRPSRAQNFARTPIPSARSGPRLKSRPPTAGVDCRRWHSHVVALLAPACALIWHVHWRMRIGAVPFAMPRFRRRFRLRSLLRRSTPAQQGARHLRGREDSHEAYFRLLGAVFSHDRSSVRIMDPFRLRPKMRAQGPHCCEMGSQPKGFDERWPRRQGATRRTWLRKSQASSARKLLISRHCRPVVWKPPLLPPFSAQHL